MVRGCGERVPGGIYAETVLGDVGMPFDFFICDSPHPVDPDWGISAIGVKQVGEDLVDWVGQKHYPNVLDFVEEGRRFGVSRRLSPNLDFERLTAKSKMMFVHAKAHIENWTDLVRASQESGFLVYEMLRAQCAKLKCEDEGLDVLGFCSTGKEIVMARRCFSHRDDMLCSGVWNLDVPEASNEGGMRWASKDQLFRTTVGTRKMPAFEYYSGYLCGVERIYAPAVFLILPITNLCVIKSDDAKLVDERLEAASASGLNVELKDE